MSRHTKTIIILVEGHSDIEALRNIISKLFDDYYNGLFNVEFIKENEDITAFKGYNLESLKNGLVETTLIPS